MALALLRELLSSSTADGSRTNALNHLQWMLAAFLGSTIVAFYSGVPHQFCWLLVAATAVLLLCYLVTHFYFMVKNPDALRSEKFTIEKMALERGLIGDSSIGLHDAAPMLKAPSTLAGGNLEGPQ